MKNQLLVFALLLLFSSCLKIEDASLCNTIPPAPQLATLSYQVALGGTLSANVVSPVQSETYTWINPYGSAFNGASLVHANVTNLDFGTWKVVANTSSACTSDTTKFTVSFSVGNCSVGADSMIFDGIGYYMYSGQGNNNFYNNYELDFSSPYYGSLAAITFPSQPLVTGVYNVTDITNTGYLPNGSACAITFQNAYAANSGTVGVSVNNSVITIRFCGVRFYSTSGGGQAVYASGNLTGS